MTVRFNCVGLDGKYLVLLIRGDLTKHTIALQAATSEFTA
jgi:hypothetical protein